MSPEAKRWVMRTVQITVTVGALLLIIRSVDLKSLPSLLWSVDLTYIFMALFLGLANFAAGAWRWQQLIYLTNGRQVSWNLLFDSYLTSYFVSSVLPGTITGDIVRIYDTRQQADGSAQAASIVFTERLLGLIFLLFLWVLAWLSLEQRPAVSLKIPAVLLPVFVVVTIALLAIWWAGGEKWGVSAKVLQWLQLLLLTTLRLPKLLIQKPFEFLKVLAGTVAFQLLALLIVFEALQAAQVPVSFGVFLAVAPLVSLAIILPVSFQGIGIRESLYLSFLVPMGARPEAVLAGLSLTYLISLPFILWGWLLYSQRAKLAAQNI